jgi:NADH-quinone oxidoreductase subunit M
MLMVAHGLSVALLFLLSTSVYQRTHTFDMDRDGRPGAEGARARGLFVAATFASIGLPGFANFWGELTIFVALWGFSHALTVVALTGRWSRPSTACGPRRGSSSARSPRPSRRSAAANPTLDLGWGEKLPAAILAAALLFIGVWPRSFSTESTGPWGAPPAAVASR